MILFIGTIGNILNRLTLSQRTFRNIPCVFFFLITSIASLISIDFGLITRALSGWAADPTYTIGWFCKLRTFIVFSSRAIVFWSIILAAVDRWLSSSAQMRHRQLRTLKNARRETFLVIIISMIVYAHLFYCYDANLIDAPFKCYAKTQACQIVADVIFACFTTILPLLCMLAFGLMTILNIHQSKRRIIHMPVIVVNQTAINTHKSLHQLKKLDRHLLRMVFVQVIVFALLTLPQAIQRLYVVFVRSNNSQLQDTIDTFVYNFVLLLTYLASAMPFYIYTLFAETLFRKALMDLMKLISRSIMRQHR
jgi:hypothetical protein